MTIGRPGFVFAPVETKVVELDTRFRGAGVRITADDDETALLRREDGVIQLVDQDEVTKMVHGELLLDAIDLRQLRQGHNSGIADQSIDRCIHGANLLGTADDAGRYGQVKVCRRGIAANAVAGSAGLLGGSRNTDYVGATQAQHPHGLIAQPRVGAGDGIGASTEIKSGSNLFRRGIFIKG